MTVFVDAGPLFARHIKRDQYHAPSVAQWKWLAADRRPLVTSNFVLDEAATLLGRRAGYAYAAEKARGWFTSKSMKILRPDADDELAALGRFTQYAGRGVSFTDCLSFALMTRHGVRTAFTFDRHFLPAWFVSEP